MICRRDAGAMAANLSHLERITEDDRKRQHPHQGSDESVVRVVELTNISKSFPGVIANRDISLQIDRATIHAIVGENGAGKSTLMKILYGLHQPDSGTIAINGVVTFFLCGICVCEILYFGFYLQQIVFACSTFILLHS